MPLAREPPCGEKQIALVQPVRDFRMRAGRGHTDADAWFINSVSRKATVEAMTSFIHTWIPFDAAEAGLDRWRLTVAKKIRNPMSCRAADVGSRRRQFHPLILPTHRRVTPPVQSAQLAQPGWQ